MFTYVGGDVSVTWLPAENLLSRCVVVLYNAKKTKQSHIFNVSKKTITSLAFSADGKHLVTGEVMRCHTPQLQP